MDYKKAWEYVKDNLEQALDEGYACGYNDPSCKEYGKFYAYQKTHDLMCRLEKSDEKEED